MSDQPADTSADTTADVPDADVAPARRTLFRKRTSAQPDPETQVTTSGTAAQAPDAAGDDADAPVRPGVLRRRRRQLLGKYEEGIFNLGGLAMEMHRRGLLGEDVMRRRAAEVSDMRGQVDDLDEQLEGVRSSRSDRRRGGRGATRICTSCGAQCRADANFCAQCGAALVSSEIAASPDSDQPTVVIVDGASQPTEVISGTDVGTTQVLPPIRVDE